MAPEKKTNQDSLAGKNDRIAMIKVINLWASIKLLSKKWREGSAHTNILPGNAIALNPGKNNNPKLTGSINEMKRLIWGMYSPEQINAVELSINQTPFSYLSHGKESYGTPFEAVESYTLYHMPWL